MTTRPAYAIFDWWLRFAVWLLAFLLFAWALSSCTTVKRVAVTGGPVAVAGGLGALAGPVGAALAAGVTAVVMVVTADNVELRSGETMSEEQLVKELERWRSKALNAESVAESLGTDVVHLRGRVSEVAAWWKAWAWRALWAALAYLGWRNREHLFASGPGYLNRLGHAIFGIRLRPFAARTDGGE